MKEENKKESNFWYLHPSILKILFLEVLQLIVMSSLKSSRDEEPKPTKKKKPSGKAVSEMNLLNETLSYDIS